jgi:transcription elongation factor GreA-like protein
MTISRATQSQLSKGDFEAVEGEWLAQMGERPDDLDYFVGVARALSGSGESGRAKTLLELLDEQLREGGRWRLRLELLRRAGHLLLPADKLHPTLVSTLAKVYGDRSLYKALFEAVGLHRAPQDVPKTWEKVERLESLLAFDIGTVVAMEGRGVGRIVEANLALESFKVDFERHKGLTVGFKAAPKLLRPLAPEHVLYRKLVAPQTLAGMSPPELLALTLASYDRALTAGEIRDVVNGVVSEAQWTSWWAAARKHPQVVAAGTGARQTYSWAATSGGALDSVWKSFARDAPRQKIERLRREGGRDAGLRDRMARDLAAIAEEVHTSEPGLAFEIWFAIERSGGLAAVGADLA